ncbi:MAG: PilZ domain-containing protein [Syntrophales bacterium]
MREKMKKTPEIRPGTHVDMIISIDYEKETADVRRSVVYEIINERQFIISQTDPPLAGYHIGRDMAVTFLARGEKGPVRPGFSAKLTGIIKDYKLSSGESVQALAMTRNSGKNNAGLYNLRMLHRVKPVAGSDLEITIMGTQANLIDISISGARISFKADSLTESVEAGRIVDIAVRVNRESFRLKARVVRMWHIPGEAHLRFAAVHFVDADKRLNYLLGGKVLEIERKILSRGLETK